MKLFLFQKTRAHRRLADDVPEEVKKRRHLEVATAWRSGAKQRNRSRIGGRELVLVEGVSASPSPILSSPPSSLPLLLLQPSRRSSEQLSGRTDGNTRAVFPKDGLPSGESIRPGDYVEIEITAANSQTMLGNAVRLSSIAEFRRSNEKQP